MNSELNIQSETPLKTLRDSNCIILKKREYEDLKKSAEKGITLHIGVSNSDNYEIDVKTHKSCIIVGTDGIDISPTISSQIYRISNHIKSEFDKQIRDSDIIVKECHKNNLESIQEDLLEAFGKLSWWKRLFFKPDDIKFNIYDYSTIEDSIHH